MEVDSRTINVIVVSFLCESLAQIQTFYVETQIGFEICINTPMMYGWN